MTRRIRPHKGGRTARYNGMRMTPDDKDALIVLLDERGMPFSDWVIEKLHDELAPPAARAAEHRQGGRMEGAG